MQLTGAAASVVSVVVLLLCVLAGATQIQIQTPKPQDDWAERARRIENGLLPATAVKGGPATAMTLAERMKHHRVPGVSIAVIDGGVIAWARSYGVVEAGSEKPVSLDTLFQAASISKPVAAMAALQMVEREKLKLDEDVNLKLKSWKVPDGELTREQKVTLRRLVSHSAGLTVHGFRGYAADEPAPTLLQALDGVKPANSAAIRVDILPGSKWRYSGGGYNVLQQLLIDISGKSFPELMRREVLERIGMEGSTYEQPLPASRSGQAATAHLRSGEPVKGKWHTYPEMAAAGLWTTPSDLARFAIELQQAYAGQSKKVISQAMAMQMLTEQIGGSGLGIGVGNRNGRPNFSHGGSNQGFRCMLFAYRDTGQGAVIMTNGDNGRALVEELMRSIAREYEWPDFRPQ